MTLRCVVWSAVSSRPQLKGRGPEEGTEDAGDSLARQIEDGRALCARRGWEVVAELQVPGHTRDYWQFYQAAEDMEAYAELQRLAEAGAMDVVVCRELDRLGRSDSLLSQVQHLLRQNGIGIFELANPMAFVEPAKEVTTDRLFMDAFKRVQAEDEILKLKRRHRGGMLNRVKYKGLPPGEVPYGYRSLGKDSVPVQVPAEVAVVRRVMQLFVQGWGHSRIAGELNRDPEMGSPRRSAKWGRSSIRRMLSNDYYVGIVHYGKITAKGAHEPVFDPEEWVGIRREQRRRRGTRGKPRWPYSGLVRCRICGQAMGATSITNRQGRVYHYYRCIEGVRVRVEGRGEGHKTNVRLEKIEGAVYGLAGALQDPRQLELACRDTAAEERETLGREREEAEAELEALRARVQRVVEGYTKWGRVAPEVFDEQMADAAEKQRELEGALAEAVALEERMPDPEMRVRRLMEYASDLKKVLGEADVYQANAWLSERVRTIWCEGREVVEVELV